MEIVKKSFFHEFVFFAHKYHGVLNMYDACINMMKYFQMVENISSYLYMGHVHVLDPRNSCAKNTNS
jgi:hypothetical protein